MYSERTFGFGFLPGCRIVSLNPGSCLYALLLLIPVLLSLLSSPAIAQMVPVTLFGPEVFTRSTGKPQTEEQQFSPAGFEAPFVLHLRNGDENGDNRVSSAWVWLNGQPIFDPSNFNQQVSGYDVEVTVTDPSVLQVKVASKPGSKLTIWIEGILTNVRPVGPEGGVFEFPNGVILNVPPGAITETTLIEVTDLPLGEVNAILSMPGYSTHKLRCIARFSAEPTGLVFQAPITAIVPVPELDPGEIPVQIEVDLIGQKYSIAPTDLVYRGEQSVVEMSILHFSETDLAGIQELYQAVDNICKTCLFYGDEQARELCEYWVAYTGQPWACFIPRAERQACAPNIECCKEKEIVVKSGEIDFATGQCQLLRAELEVTFPQCPGIPPFKEDYGETSIECPENMEVVIIPSNPSIYICEEITLEAKLTSKDDEGNIVLSKTIPAKGWRLLPEDSDVAEIREVPPTTVVVLGLQEGTVEIYAQSPDPRFEGQTTLNVQKPELEIISGDGDFLMDVGDEETWDALCVTCPDGEVVWGTNRPDVVELTELAGDAVRVRAISKGAAEIRANFICGVPQPVEYVATLVVEQEVASVEINPNTATISVNQTLPLTVTVRDKHGNPLPGGCPSAIVWTIPPKIIGFDPINQIVRGVSEGTAIITAMCEGVPGTATVKVTTVQEPPCEICWVYIEQQDAKICMDQGLQLTLEVRDFYGNPVECSSVLWSTSDPSIANITPHGAVSGLVIGVRPGTATITGNCDGVRAFTEVTVMPGIGWTGTETWQNLSTCWWCGDGFRFDDHVEVNSGISFNLSKWPWCNEIPGVRIHQVGYEPNYLQGRIQGITDISDICHPESYPPDLRPWHMWERGEGGYYVEEGDFLIFHNRSYDSWAAISIDSIQYYPELNLPNCYQVDVTFTWYHWAK